MESRNLLTGLGYSFLYFKPCLHIVVSDRGDAIGDPDNDMGTSFW